jgi:ABC-type antimicrobial peptide transport system permease subunit
MYTPLDQQRVRDARIFGSLFVRTTRDPREVAGALRDAMRPALAAEPSQPQFVDDYFRRATAGRRFNATLMASLGFIALAIGALGIYGTMAYVVARQIRSIGLRMALGASPGRVMRLVLKDALRRVAVGTAIGLMAAWALSGALVSFVFGVRPTEPVVYAGVGCFLAGVGVAAALIPALRASRLDPLVVMRHE